MSYRQDEVSYCDNNRLDSNELVDDRTETEHIVQPSNGEHIIQPSDNAADNNFYDEPADSLRKQTSAGLSDPVIGTEKEGLKPEERECHLNRERRRYALQELVDTERTYILDLEKVVGGYMEVIRTGLIEIPRDLKRGKIRFVFGNIKEIYDFHREHFLARLEACLEEPEQLGRIFKQCERQMSMYVRYHKNKPYSEYIVSEYDETFFARIQQQLSHTLTLSDYLIKPVQRPMMYKLLLTSILEKSKKAGITEGVEDLNDAVKLMHLLPQMSNDMLEIGRIQGFKGRLGTQELLRKGQLLVLDMSPGSPGAVSNRIRFKRRRVFLFEQIIIFCEMIDGRTKFSKPTFYFKRSLPLNKTKLHHEGMEPLQFLLTTKSELEEGETFVFQASSEKDRKEWIQSIDGVLKLQEVLVIALGSPIAYHEGHACESPSPKISENPLPPHIMLRVSSVKQKTKKKFAHLSETDQESKDHSSCSDHTRMGAGSSSPQDTPSTKRKNFLHETRIFRSLKRILRNKEHSHI